MKFTSLGIVPFVLVTPATSYAISKIDPLSSSKTSKSMATNMHFVEEGSDVVVETLANYVRVVPPDIAVSAYNKVRTY
jgi:hypothetical protein